MSACKYCGEEIEWREKDGKKFPANPTTGARHECKKEGQNTSTSSTPPAHPVMPIGPITVEGNIADIDFDARFFTLEDRAGKVFVKIFWKPPQEQTARKQKVGYYEAPVVEMEENTGGLQEAILVDLPYKPRPDNFPRPQKKGGYGGGRSYQPRNERIIVAQCLVKAYTELWINTHTVDGVDFDIARKEILDAVEADLPRVMKAGGA